MLLCLQNNQILATSDIKCSSLLLPSVCGQQAGKALSVNKFACTCTLLQRVGQNRIVTLYMAVKLVISLPKNTVYTPSIYGSSQPYLSTHTHTHPSPSHTHAHNPPPPSPSLTHTHTHIRIHTHAYTHTHARTPTHMHTHVHTHTHTYAYTHTRIHTHTRAHTHTCTHMCTRTHTHTRRSLCLFTLCPQPH